MAPSPKTARLRQHRLLARPNWPRVQALLAQLRQTPLLILILSLLLSVALERLLGLNVARLLGLRDMPVLFGILDIFSAFEGLDLSGILSPLFPTTDIPNPLSLSWQALLDVGGVLVRAVPRALLTLLQVSAYNIIIYVIPLVVLARLLARPGTRLIGQFSRHLQLLLLLLASYGVIWLWAGETAYRELVLMYLGINIILAASLNLINGYMGEFSVGHAGFMGVGAYVSSVLTLWLFTDDTVFGPAVLPFIAGLPLGIGTGAGFLLALFVGGVAAALVGLLVAIPSFRTRGDYLAIVTLAVNFIVQAAINNLEFIGGPRGLRGIPLWTNLAWIFVMTLISLVLIKNLVSSTFGKGIIAIREDEIAADLMGVNTRRVKLVAFLVSSFLAGVAGGLFAHVLAYVNPGVFGILKSTEVLVMVYLGGMGSITGSVVAAFIFTILVESLRPLGVLKWVLIPLLLILLMLYRPQGLFGNREWKFNWFIPKQDKES